ncbi:uncharacterized protein LOC134216295 [Armigeres subalbatus]|uniref:uncharacterized protein LOC134216295 n=1 Tax=Armigeres subalbatus TaxID=124917 RepID=UPI002ED2D630
MNGESETGFDLLLDAATQIDEAINYRGRGHDHRYSMPGPEQSTCHTADTSSSMFSSGVSSFTPEPRFARVGSSAKKRLVFSDMSDAINRLSPLPWNTKSRSSSSLPERSSESIRARTVKQNNNRSILPGLTTSEFNAKHSVQFPDKTEKDAVNKPRGYSYSLADRAFDPVRTRATERNFTSDNSSKPQISSSSKLPDSVIRSRTLFSVADRAFGPNRTEVAQRIVAEKSRPSFKSRAQLYSLADRAIGPVLTTGYKPLTSSSSKPTDAVSRFKARPRPQAVRFNYVHTGAAERNFASDNPSMSQTSSSSKLSTE